MNTMVCRAAPLWATNNFLAVVHPLDRERVDTTAAENTKKGTRYNLKFRVIHPNREERTLESSAKPLMNEAGVAVKVVGAVRDITEAEQLESLLRQSQKMEAVGQLTAGVAHDFNNILSGVMGNLELVRGDIEPGTKNAERLSWAVTSVKRGAELTDRLLAFSRQ